MADRGAGTETFKNVAFAVLEGAAIGSTLLTRGGAVGAMNLALGTIVHDNLLGSGANGGGGEEPPTTTLPTAPAETTFPRAP